MRASTFLLALALAGCPKAPAPAEPVAFLADDWEEAKKQASGRLVFVDAWAPWCHTCWSMKREVLHDPALAAYAAKVLFVEIDTDRPQNAAFVARFPVRVWPTFFAVDPVSETIVSVQGGSMSLKETRAFLDRALALRTADATFGPAYRALQAGDPAAAALAFEGAISVPGQRRTEAVFGAVRAWLQAKNLPRCLDVATRGLKQVEGSASVGDLSGYVLACSEKLPDAERRAAREPAQQALEGLLAAPATGASVDDRADHMATLADLYEGLGRKDDARGLHEQRLLLLEADAERAKTPAEARTHDYARMNSYLALDRGAEAVALFQQRMTQFPEDYEVHARLASTLSKMKRVPEAIDAAARAVALSYGPRQLRYRKLLAELHEQHGDVASAQKAWQELVDANSALPAGMKNDELAAAAAAALKKTRTAH